MASGREPRVAVVGATGTVGSQIADLIGEREFPCSELILFAAEAGSSDSVESAGNRTYKKGKKKNKTNEKKKSK